MCNLYDLMRLFIHFREFEIVVTNDERISDKRSHSVTVDLAASGWKALDIPENENK